MYSVRVSTTDDRELPAPNLGLGLGWDRLTEILRREISSDAAELLAEPIQDAVRSQTHWHVVANEDPKPLAELGPEEREQILLALEDRRQKILKLASTVAARGTEADTRLAAALHKVIDVPDSERHIWSVDGKPVLIAWGRAPQNAPARAATIVARGQAAQVGQGPSGTIVGRADATNATGAGAAVAAGAAGGALGGAATVTQQPARSSWRPSPGIWLWALLAAMVLTILFVLLPSCAVDVPVLSRILDRCPHLVARDDLAGLRERNASLREAIRAAERRVARREGDCAPPRQRADVGPRPGPDSLTPRPGTDSPRAPDARETEDRSRRNQGTEGVLDITLAWNGREDLDLHVECPGGKIWANQRNACGGTLEIDRNAQASDRTDSPVEHVTWTGQPPSGDYRIMVALYERFELAPRDIPFTVVVRDGDKRTVYPGIVNEVKVAITVTRFRR